MFYEAQYNDAAALNPSLTTADEIHKAVNWWIFNSFGGPTLINRILIRLLVHQQYIRGKLFLMLFVQVKS